MSSKLPRVLLGLEIGSMLLGGSCNHCRVCLIGHMRVVWESDFGNGKGRKVDAHVGVLM